MHILVTAGPTREYLDPVRFLSNRSSGKMGYAIAASALAQGHSVTLVTGPVALPAPEGAVLVPVVSARDMLAAVQDLLPSNDALVMAAAVADWRPAVVEVAKLKKRNMQPAIQLEPNPDILLSVAPLKQHRTFVGFAAETEHVLEEARDKLVRKGLDLIVANDVSQPDAGFEVDTNRVTLLSRHEAPLPLPLLSKAEVANRIVLWIECHAAGVKAAQPGGDGGRDGSTEHRQTATAT